MLERSAQRGCCRFATIANRSEGGRLLFRPLSHIATWGAAVLIYLFRDEVTASLAFTIDVTSHNLSPVVPSTDWFVVETIDTPTASPPSDVADFQRLLYWLRVDGFYLFEAGVKDPKKLPAGWARLRRQ